MIFSKMFVQRFFSFWGKTAHIASKWLFSSMRQNMTWHPRRLFHDFLTYRTLVLSILKNDGHNNLQQYFKYSNLFFKNKKLLRLIAHNKGVKKDLVHCFSLFPNNEHFGHVSSTFLSYLRHNHNNHKPRAFLQCEAGYDGLPCICLSLFSDIKDIVLAHPQELLV